MFQEYPTIGSTNTLAGLEMHTRTRLPLLDRPEVCGLHPLADTFCRERLSRDLFDIILSIEPQVASVRARYERLILLLLYTVYIQYSAL